MATSTLLLDKIKLIVASSILHHTRQGGVNQLIARARFGRYPIIRRIYLIAESDGRVHTLVDVKRDNIQNCGFNTPRSVRFPDKLRRAQHSSTGSNQP